MRSVVGSQNNKLCFFCILLCGCTSGPLFPQYAVPTFGLAESVDCVSNPLLVPSSDYQVVWEEIVDVLDDYFRIEREEPVRHVGDYLTEGQIDTYPTTSATYLEPWINDSRGYQRLEATLQSMRRSAQVRVIPEQGGYLVSVIVQKELEDLEQPENATASAASFRNDSALRRYSEPVETGGANAGWIPMGRDLELEQQILGQIHGRIVGDCESPVVLQSPTELPNISAEVSRD